MNVSLIKQIHKSEDGLATPSFKADQNSPLYNISRISEKQLYASNQTFNEA